MSAGENSKDIIHDPKWLLKINREANNDVTLCTDDGRQIKAHKCLLAAASAYFNAMFAGDMAEKHQSSVTLHDVCGQMMQLLVDYMYTGEMVLNEDNVQGLMVTADSVEMLAVRDECCTFLMENLTITNYVDVIVLAKQYSCQQLYDYVCKYCKEHFPGISNSKSFSVIPMPTLIELISSDDVIVNSEEWVYHSVISWVKSDLDTRRTHLPKLMSYVRLPLLSKQFIIDEVRQEQLITSDNECLKLLVDGMAYHLSEPSDRSRSWAVKPRTPEHAILVHGGLGVCRNEWANGVPPVLNDGECYNRMTNKWDNFDPTPSLPLQGAGAAVLGNRMYIVGGRCSEAVNPLSTVYCRDFHGLTDVASMIAARVYHAVTMLDNKIYAVGGFTNTSGGASPTCSAEVYDPALRQWHSIASMNVARVHLGLAAVNGYLFAVGGSQVLAHEILSSVERYDPAADQWSLVSDMPGCRSRAGVTTLDNKLYVLGGCRYGGGPGLRSCIVYDPVTDTWSSIADMNEYSGTSNAGAVALNGQLYVCGGRSAVSGPPTSSVARYGPHTNTWHREANMSKARTNFRICVIRYPPFTPRTGEEEYFIV